MNLQSAGLLLYRTRPEGVEVLLVHPGGPFFRGRDDGWWTVPKGLLDSGEEALAAARREFEEETGFPAPAHGPFVDLGVVRQKGGKAVQAWAVEGDCDPALLRSNTFRLEWPPRPRRPRRRKDPSGGRDTDHARSSGRLQEFPEVDRAAFFTLDQARRKINAAQVPFLDRLERLLRARA